MIKHITISRAARTDADRAAFRWSWTVTLGGGITETITADYDDTHDCIVIERNGELVGCYEGQRKATSLAKAAKTAIDEIYS